MLSPFDSLIFDLDGTLWDSTAPVADAWNETLTDLGNSAPPLTAKDVSRIMGMPHEKVFETLLPSANPKQREKFAKRFYEKEMSALRHQGGRLFPGVREGLKTMEKQFPLYIVSNCQPDYLVAFFDITGLKALFKGSECHGNTGKTKAENIALVVERFGLKTSAYIGDTGSDQQAAIRAGVEYFHIEHGFGTPIRDCLRFKNFERLTEFFCSP